MNRLWSYRLYQVCPHFTFIKEKATKASIPTEIHLDKVTIRVSNASRDGTNIVVCPNKQKFRNEIGTQTQKRKALNCLHKNDTRERFDRYKFGRNNNNAYSVIPQNI